MLPICAETFKVSYRYSNTLTSTFTVKHDVIFSSPGVSSSHICNSSTYRHVTELQLITPSDRLYQPSKIQALIENLM